MRLDTLADIKLVRRAMRSGWNVPDEVKREVVIQLAAIAQTAEKDRDRIAAASTLMKADELDAKQERADEQRRLQLLGILKSLPPGELARLAPAGLGVVEAGSASDSSQ